MHQYLQDNGASCPIALLHQASALIKVVDDWQRALDQGYELCVVVLMSQKRLILCHIHGSLLPTKLNEFGLDPYLLRWIRNYLSDGSQYACVDGTSSHAFLLYLVFLKGQFWALFSL